LAGEKASMAVPPDYNNLWLFFKSSCNGRSECTPAFGVM
jgi:hypothetical protein